MGFFSPFTRKSLVRPFAASTLPDPRARTCYNDDICLPAYASAARTFDDTHRKGLQEGRLSCGFIRDHVEEAARAPFFLSLKTPLPDSIENAVKSVSATPQKTIISSWHSQLGRIRTFSPDALPADITWNSLIPLPIRPAADKVRAASLMSLLPHQNLGGPSGISNSFLDPR